MKERAIVSWLWAHGAGVLREYLSGRKRAVIVPEMFCSAATAQIIEAAGSRVVVLESLLSEQAKALLGTRAAERAAAIIKQTDAPQWKAFCRKRGVERKFLEEKLIERLQPWLHEQFFLIDALNVARSRYLVEMMVLNEDWQRAPKTAVHWARNVGIPTVHVDHGLVTCVPYTVHSDLESDYLLVSGMSSREAYLDGGYPSQRVLVTGAPSVDKYAVLARQKMEFRQYLMLEYKLDPALPIVVFASTWNALPLSALSDPDLYNKSLEAFFHALNQLHVRGITVNAIIKDRPANLPGIADRDEGVRTIREIILNMGKRLGVGEHRYTFTFKDTEPLVVGSDVVVAIDSGMTVEAMLAGTPTINLANFFGLRFGPFFEAGSGVLEAEFATLGNVLANLLTSPKLVEQARQAMAANVERYNLGTDGRAAERVAKFMASLTTGSPMQANAAEPKPEKLDSGSKGEVQVPAPGKALPAVSGRRIVKNKEDQMANTKTVLHVGCGPENAAGLHRAFQGKEWREIRLDIDPDVKPEIIGTLTDMGMVPDGHVDAVWSSHNVEHIFSHQVPVALREFYRVLKPGSFALVTLPDLQAAAEMVAADQLDEVAYDSPAGPITPIDMIYSYRRFLLGENEFMCHRTGFTARTLYRALRSAGFSSVAVERHEFCLWATAWKEPVALPRAMSGWGKPAYIPQDEDEMLVGCRLWRRGQEENPLSYRTLHELRITAGQERLAPVVLLERPEEIPFIPYFNELLDRCRFLVRLVVIAPFAAPPGWHNNERQEWLKLPGGVPGFVTKALRSVPGDWVGLLKPAPLSYARPLGVISLTGDEAEALPETLFSQVPETHLEALESSDGETDGAPAMPLAERCRNLREWLLAGDYEQGLAALDVCAEPSPAPNAGLPRWDGGIRANTTLLLQAGKDWGEAIQMVRYARYIAERGMRVVVQCPREIEGVLQTHDGVALTYDDREAVQSGDYVLPMSSLPHLFETHADSIPLNIPYLFSRFEDVVSWRERLFPHDQTIKIGLYWNDPALAGALLEGLADIPGVTFLDLKGEISAGNIVPIPGLGDVPANYSPVLDVLDMVVAEESWVLHLAGALGRTAWGVLPEDHGWCWGRGDHSPWYPRTLLFRRRQGREWHEVAAGIRALLEQVMGDVLSEQGATGNNE